MVLENAGPAQVDCERSLSFCAFDANARFHRKGLIILMRYFPQETFVPDDPEDMTAV